MNVGFCMILHGFCKGFCMMFIMQNPEGVMISGVHNLIKMQ